MANALGLYNPLFYAQEGLMVLENALGMASRVHRGYDEERRSFAKGETVNIRKPSTLTVSDAPATAQDLNTQSATISLDYWREAKFKLSDKELAFTGERIVNEHVRPAMYSLANDIDVKLATMWDKVPHFIDKTGSALVGTDIVDVRSRMFANKVPLHDQANMHLMVGGTEEGELLKDSQFVQHQGAGLEGVDAQRTGHLSRKYGFEIFANQNTPTSGTVGTNADLAGAVNGAHVKGATSVAIDGHTTSGTLVAGDSIEIDGYVYAITANLTLSSGAGTVTIYPGLRADVADNAVTAIVMRGTGTECLAFHRNAFALVTAPLSEMGNELGAKIATVQDPITGLALRSRLYYVGNSSEVHVAFDVLYGFPVLDGELACRMTS